MLAQSGLRAVGWQDHDLIEESDEDALPAEAPIASRAGCSQAGLYSIVVYSHLILIFLSHHDILPLLAQSRQPTST